MVVALAAMRLGDKAEARKALEAAIELKPQNSFALRSLGSLLVIAGPSLPGWPGSARPWRWRLTI